MSVAHLGTIYLLHFDQPFKHAKHYLGWAGDRNWSERIEQHRRGQGSKLMAAVVRAGIGFQLARLWENVDRHRERRMKAAGKSRLCPVCLGREIKQVASSPRKKASQELPF